MFIATNPNQFNMAEVAKDPKGDKLGKITSLLGDFRGKSILHYCNWIEKSETMCK